MPNVGFLLLGLLVVWTGVATTQWLRYRRLFSSVDGLLQTARDDLKEAKELAENAETIMRRSAAAVNAERDLRKRFEAIATEAEQQRDVAVQRTHEALALLDKARKKDRA